MHYRSRRPWLVAAVVVATCLHPAITLGLTFSASCDRFEADGNEFGSAGGAFDYVDDFANGTLSPDWTVLLGTAVESGGVVTVRDPGITIPLGSNVLEISTIENDFHGVSNGSGDLTALSHWVSLPTMNSEFHMQLYSISPIVEAAGITVNQGGAAGYSISQSVTQGFGSSFTTIDSDSVAISPASVTGQIVLRLSLDDATDMLTCSFSLDGGATFQSPFPPMHVFNTGVFDYEMLLGAAGISGGGSSGTVWNVPLKVFEARNPNGPESRKVRYNIQAPNLPPPHFGDPVTHGATLNVKLDGVSQCFHLPAPFWTSRNSVFSYRYVDRTGYYGPVKMLAIRRNGRLAVQSKAVILGRFGALDVVPQGTTSVEADLRLHFNTGEDYCGSTLGGDIASNDGTRFRVKNSAAPVTCPIPACSPSGAFLDASGPPVRTLQR